MAVDVLCRGVRNDVAAKLDRTAVNRCCERVVHDERNAVVVRESSELLDVEDVNCRICDGLAEYALCVRADVLLELFKRQSLVNECALNAHLLECNAEEIVCAAVDIGRCDEMVACLADVEYCEEVCCLAGACEHSCKTALHSAELRSYEVICGVLESCVEISGSLEVKELAHVFGSSVLPCGALIDRYLAGFAVAGIVAAVKRDCVNCAHLYVLLSYY